MRQVALLRRTRRRFKTRHLVGLPPELTGGVDTGYPLPRAEVVVLETRPEGVFLVRFTRDGEFAGDTWHPTADEAHGQADFEFGDALGPWKDVPDDASDPVAFALSSPAV